MYADDTQMLSSLAYHPYVALTASFNFERTIGASPEGNSTARFKEHCKQLRSDLLRDAEKYPCGRPAPVFDAHLHMPLCMSAFGPTDAWTLTLLDNFVAAARLTSVTTGIVNSEVHLCPRVETICLESGHTTLPVSMAAALGKASSPHWPFFDPQDLFHSDTSVGSGCCEDSIRLPASLCVTMLFKSGMLTTIPHGVLLQSAVLATIVSTVRKVMTGLFLAAERGDQLLYSMDDVLSAKCLLLEPQGADDVAIVFFCRNFSVASSALEVLRTLTIKDAFNVAPEVIEHGLTRSNFHDLVVALARLQKQQPQSGSRLDRALDSIGGNHLFMRSYSTLCFSESFLDSDPVNISGWCEPRFYVDSHAGHELEIEECFKDARRDVGNAIEAAKFTLSPIPHRLLTGVHDTSFELHPSSSQYVSVDATLRFLKTFITNLMKCKKDRQLSNPLAEASFTHVTSAPIIPVPRIEEDVASSIGACFPGGQVVRKVDWKSHLFGKDFFSRVRAAAQQDLDLTDLLRFRDELRTIGCPSSLQYSIVYLCQEFLDCLGDPLRFEAVIDLYDSFASLIRILKPDGPIRSTITSLDTSWARRKYVAETLSSGSFKAYVDALLNAFRLRIETAIQHYGFHDTAFTFRFGVAKLIGATDVVLKCSVGLFRAVDSPSDNANEPDDIVGYLKFRRRYGSVTSISHRLHTSAHACLWPGERASALLAIDMDVFHLFRPEQGYYFLHEVAHLFMMRRASVNLPDLFLNCCDEPNDEGQSNADMRAEEVFADLLASLFVFEHEKELFARFHMLTFAVISGRVIQLASESDPERYQSCIFEVVVRGFLVSELQTLLMPTRVTPGTRIMELIQPEEAASLLGSAPEVYRKLSLYSEEFGRHFPDLVPFWKDTTDLALKMRSLCHEVASEIALPEFGHEIGRLTNGVIKVWNSYWSTSQVQDMATDGRDFDTAVSEGIQRSLREGRSFLRSNWSKGNADNRDSGLECLYVVCRLIREYMRIVLGLVDADRQVFVRDGQATSMADASRGMFSPLLMHESHIPFYAVHPEVRKEKLLAQIGYVKTLSDVSMQLRSRRVVDLGKLSERFTQDATEEDDNNDDQVGVASASKR